MLLHAVPERGRREESMLDLGKYPLIFHWALIVYVHALGSFFLLCNKPQGLCFHFLPALSSGVLIKMATEEERLIPAAPKDKC